MRVSKEIVTERHHWNSTQDIEKLIFFLLNQARPSQNLKIKGVGY